MKLLEAVDLYIATAGTLHTPQSRLGMRKYGRQFAAYCGNRELDTYTTADLTAFCLGHGGRGQAPNTVNTRKGLLGPFFRWAAYHGHIPTDPASALAITVRPGTGGVRNHTWLDKEQVVAIGDAFNLEDPRQHRDVMVFRTTVMLALRRSETASLRWESFGPSYASATYIGKGRKVRNVVVPPVLRAELTGWHSVLPVAAVLFPSFRWEFDDAGNAQLEPQWQLPLGASGVYKIVKAIASAHGVPSLAPHDLRRSCAGILEAQGVGLRDIQGVLGHSQLATTDRYMQKNPGRLAAAVEGVDWT